MILQLYTFFGESINYECGGSCTVVVNFFCECFCDMSTCHVDSCGTWDDTGGYSGFATTAASEFLTRNGSPPSQICGSLGTHDWGHDKGAETRERIFKDLLYSWKTGKNTKLWVDGLLNGSWERKTSWKILRRLVLKDSHTSTPCAWRNSWSAPIAWFKWAMLQRRRQLNAFDRILHLHFACTLPYPNTTMEPVPIVQFEDLFPVKHWDFPVAIMSDLLPICLCCLAHYLGFLPAGLGRQGDTPGTALWLLTVWGHVLDEGCWWSAWWHQIRM